MHRMAVAIINWNTRNLLRDCLRSVFADAPGESVEVVVVDNGSTDGSAEMVRAEFPDVRLEVLHNNPGYGAASNVAFQQCTAPYVLLLNSDTVLRRGTLRTLAWELDAHPRAGIIGPRLLNADGSLQASCFPFPGPIVPLFKRQPFAGLAQLLPRLGDRFPVRFGHDVDRRVPWVVGAVLAIRREAFDAVGGFDESFHMYFEEVDLCYRMREAGWETRFTPAAEVVHLGGASTQQRRAPMRIRLSLSAMEFHRHHRRGPSLALALGLERASIIGRLLRDTARYGLATNGAARDRLAEDLVVWREVLVRSSRQQ
jgi:GT2 family glycosyltransferase